MSPHFFLPLFSFRLTRLSIFAGLLLAGGAVFAQTPALKSANVPDKPLQVFQKYCFKCHGLKDPEGSLSVERLLAQASVGPHADAWEKVAEKVEFAEMPPADADALPTDAERTALVDWVRGTLKKYEREHSGDPGRVTVRRLTSGEYGYAIRDLTGVDIDTGVDASSDSVGGEGFTNFGDVQFVQDASLERYLQAAKVVAEHAVVGAGPLEFSPDTGRTGQELFALTRLNELHAAHGFRVVSGEGGRPFGLERLGKAFFLAWEFKHRAALGEARVTLKDLAAREGLTEAFVQHVWSVVNRPKLGYPTSEFVARWKAIPAPTADVSASKETARAAATEVQKFLTTWPSWFFGRGDMAAGGAGDESPLVFDDTSLKVTPSFHYTLALGANNNRGGGRGRGTPLPAPGAPVRVYLTVASLTSDPGAKPVVIWRNPQIIVRETGGGGFARGGRGAGGAGAGNAGFNGGADGAAAGVAGAVTLPVAGEAEPVPAGNGNNRRAARGGAVLSGQPLREFLPPEVAASLGFGRSLDGSPMGPNDLAATETISFEVKTQPGQSIEFQADAELGADRNGVFKLIVTDHIDGPPARGAQARVFLGDPASEGYKTFRAGIAEYVTLLPPNSHGEANPADKDPVPLPFDSTFNTPEHDAFVLKVKYQRTDQFLAAKLLDPAERVKLEQAWNNLFDAFPYHDNYLGLLAEHYDYKLPTPKLGDLTPAQVAAMPAAMQPEVEKLRVEFAAVKKAQASAEPHHMDDVLAFASRAWRRPLTRAEKSSLHDFYQQSKNENGLDHDASIRAVIARVLVSPAFLYRMEPVAARRERPLNDWEMASRLSFFLWSSIPDDELRRAAEAGELSKPAAVAAQVRRMVADPKARRLGEEFFGQWLGFYHFDRFRGVDTGRFPEFTAEVQSAMYDEAVSTFEYLVRQNRPVRELIHADYAFVNQPLAKFYGITREIPAKEELTKIEGANALNRGGALRLGAVLTVTSAPLRSSPVKRGDWVLRRILGTPTPPPPGNAGTLPADPKTFGDLTLREKLNEHKRNPTCAACHLKIDPLGFPLEGFDAVGRPRLTYDDGKPVDTDGEMLDKRVLAGTDGLLKYLDEREPQVMRTLARKMIGYSLGRTVLASDKQLIDEMTAAGGKATFADLAVKIATSRQFRYRAGHESPEAATKVVTRVSPSASAPSVN